MNKQVYVKEAAERSQIPLNNVPNHIETKQSLCNENQLAGFYTPHKSSSKVISEQTAI